MAPNAHWNRAAKLIAVVITCSMVFGCGHEPVSVVLTYEVAKNDDAPQRPDVMQSIVKVVNSRLGDAGKARAVGDKRIEVELYGTVDDERLKKFDRQIVQPGSLEFAILANYRRHKTIIEQALKSPDREVRQGGRVVAGWRPVGHYADGRPKDAVVRPDIEASRVVKRDEKPVTELLMVFEPPERRVTGEYITRASPDRDQNGRPAVWFNLNKRGAFLFAALTGDYQPEPDDFHHRLTVLIDDQIHSAPNLITVIADSAQITGDFTQAEVEELVEVLNAGALPCAIKKVDERRVSTP